MKKSPFDLSYQNIDLDSKIVASLERISQAFRVLLWNESKELTMSPIQIQILIFLLNHSEEKRKVSYLAEEFNLTKATISDSIKALQNKKLIRKTFEIEDSRSYTIHLTANGRRMAEQTSLFTQQIQSPIEKMKFTDKENLLSSLLGIIHSLNKSGIINIQRMCFTCHFYNNIDKGNEHYCELLNAKLANNQLRLDCEEHILALGVE
ncbi:MAG: winged helix-turn-helix transcriptional regulator [Saprospiraceae bacterium]|nr:winged helix-turn-helix transcriptional regulator [Saprospiraceae bacterium]